MSWFQQIVDLFLHLDRHLNEMVNACHYWSYVVLFIIIFCETGVVILPFLPGDSLLFACGALAATDNAYLNVWWMFILLSVAAIIGDSVNYQIGHYIGPKVFTQKHRRWLKKEHLDRTHNFYEKHGGKTIIIARFIPIIRTFAPFVAGIGAMTYGKFLLYNIVGGVLWVGSFLGLGYFFGNLPLVKRNFTLVILAIIVISVLPGVVEFIRNQRRPKTTPQE